jgi:hypothetical protein
MRISPAQQLGKEVLLLLVGAVAQQVEAAEHAAAVGHDQVGARAGELLGDDCHVDDVAAEPAILFGERQAKQSGFSPGLVKLVRIEPLAVELADVVSRCHALHQLARGLPQHELFVREIAVHLIWSRPMIGSAYQTLKGDQSRALRTITS